MKVMNARQKFQKEWFGGHKAAQDEVLELMFNVRWHSFVSQVAWDRSNISKACEENPAYHLVTKLIHDGYYMGQKFNRRMLRIK